MAVNHIQLGDVMPWANATGSDVLSGAAVLVGGKLGVALGDIAASESGELAVCEVFSLPKEAALAVDQGAVLYWDNTAGVLTTAAVAADTTDNTLAGFAFGAALAADGTVAIKLNA